LHFPIVQHPESDPLRKRTNGEGRIRRKRTWNHCAVSNVEIRVLPNPAAVINDAGLWIVPHHATAERVSCKEPMGSRLQPHTFAKVATSTTTDVPQQVTHRLEMP
jgi:hypothetical protein